VVLKADDDDALHHLMAPRDVRAVAEPVDEFTDEMDCSEWSAEYDDVACDESEHASAPPIPTPDFDPVPMPSPDEAHAGALSDMPTHRRVFRSAKDMLVALLADGTRHFDEAAREAAESAAGTADEATKVERSLWADPDATFDVPDGPSPPTYRFAAVTAPRIRSARARGRRRRTTRTPRRARSPGREDDDDSEPEPVAARGRRR